MAAIVTARRPRWPGAAAPPLPPGTPLPHDGERHLAVSALLPDQGEPERQQAVDGAGRIPGADVGRLQADRPDQLLDSRLRRLVSREEQRRRATG